MSKKAKKTLLVGDTTRLEAVANHPIMKLAPQVLNLDLEDPAGLTVEPFGFIIDLNLDEEEFERLDLYYDAPDAIVLGCAVKESLARMFVAMDDLPPFDLFGLNAFPTFVDKPIWEISALDPDKLSRLTDILQPLGIGINIVQDQIGMVTPRVVCQIINEAYFMWQEGSASREDIDMAMKLGVNYPYGPFEWAGRIGIEHVYQTLVNLGMELNPSVYRVSGALAREYYRTFRPRPRFDPMNTLLNLGGFAN